MSSVSVVIPAHNAADCIAQTLESVISQTGVERLDIIVVNDGSTDETRSVLAQFGSGVRIIEQPQQGVAAARNAGIRAAVGRYIAFVDADDIWHPEKLSAQLAAFQDDPDLGVVYGEFLAWNPHHPPNFPVAHLDPAALTPALSGWIYHRLLLTNWVLTSTAVMRASCFENIDLFDIGLPCGEDWDLFLRLSRRVRFAKLRDVVALYRQHPQQATRRVRVIDYQNEVVESAIRRFGIAGPDGARPDPREFRRRRFNQHVAHGIQHLRAGDPRVAGRAFADALRYRPLSLRALCYLCASRIKQALRTLALRDG